MGSGRDIFYRYGLRFAAWLILFSASVLPMPASSEDLMSFTAVPPSNRAFAGDVWAIYADGDIDDDAHSRLEKLIKQNKMGRFSFVYFNSPGGDVISAMKMGKIIRQYQFSTSIGKRSDGDPGVCASACVLAYLGGTFRFKPDEGVIGVHRFFSKNVVKDPLDAAQVISGIIISYISEMGVDPELYTHMSRVSSDDISVLDNYTLHNLSVVDNGYRKTIWTIESVETALYLKGIRATYFGTNKYLLNCFRDGKVVLYIMFDPQGRQEQIAKMPVVSLLVDEDIIDAKEKMVGKPIWNGVFLQAWFLVDSEFLTRLRTANSVGVMFRNSQTTPVFLGFQGMEFGPARTKLAGLLSSCSHQISKSDAGIQPSQPRQWAKPSFSCAKAQTPTERAICKSETLSRLDVQLSNLYAAARRTRHAKRYKQTQRAWLKKRNACGSNASCLEQRYRERIGVFQTALQ